MLHEERGRGMFLRNYTRSAVLSWSIVILERLQINRTDITYASFLEKAQKLFFMPNIFSGDMLIMSLFIRAA
jgi:hypothetical protein